MTPSTLTQLSRSPRSSHVLTCLQLWSTTVKSTQVRVISRENFTLNSLPHMMHFVPRLFRLRVTVIRMNYHERHVSECMRLKTVLMMPFVVSMQIDGGLRVLKIIRAVHQTKAHRESRGNPPELKTQGSTTFQPLKSAMYSFPQHV